MNQLKRVTLEERRRKKERKKERKEERKKERKEERKEERKKERKKGGKKKEWQIPKCCVENRRNTDAALSSVTLT